MTAALDTLPPVAAAKPLTGRPQSPWDAEVRGIPAELLFELPVAPALALHVPGVEGVVRITRDGEAEDGAAFDLDEWAALVVGAEADRLWERDFAVICRRKRDEPAYRVGRVDALAGAQPDPSERWDVGAVLERLGAHLLSVDLGV